MTRQDWDKVLEELHPVSFRWAITCCRGDREEARDVLQSVYVDVLDGRARFEGLASVRTWLFAVIRRTAASSRRRGLVRSVLLGQWARRRPEPVAPDPAERLEKAERIARIRAAMQTLSERQRQVLELVFHHDLTIEEAAGVLGIGLGSARTHYERGKRALHDRLTEAGL
ncbi:MAG TPA: RNA polymerase sigma factor [Candidatus Polarisedimenticolia bacterium]|jgi:RNA polymerase sigma-70 factor (ECF subfamily)|nr:RNA polymerase sigma factor [Candidatus Polarisedimenticolia bacterium]